MSRSNNAPPRSRSESYFTASYEVSRHLSEGKGEEAVAVLRREFERTKDDGDDSRRFLLSQIAVCHAQMGDKEECGRVLEEIEHECPRDTETALMLAEGYLQLLGDTGRASHHASLALQSAEEADESSPQNVSRAQTLIARACLRSRDLVGAYGVWRAAPLPDWKFSLELLQAGYDRSKIRFVLAESLPRHQAFERENGRPAANGSEQMTRLIRWIDAGCPRQPQQQSKTSRN